MKNWKNILLEGIEILQNSDEKVNNLIAARKDEIVSLLIRYINEVELFNPAYGLVGTNNTNDLVIKHILDSLAPAGILINLLSSFCATVSPDEISPKLKIADAGSGAGLPGIPLSIFIPQCDFTLIERMGRRAGFLLNTKAALSLLNVDIEEKELEKVPVNQFNLITFRAFKPLEPKLLKALFKVCVPGGIIAAYKGRREKIEAEIQDITDEQKAFFEIIPYKVPFLDEERHLLIVKKLP